LENAENKIGKEDYTFDEKLEIEKETFGFYFSANPMDKYKDMIEDKNISELRDLIKGKKWKKGTTYGLVTKAYPHRISTGTMCFLDLQGRKEDKVSITIWPETYEKYKKILKEGEIIAIKVKPGTTKTGDPCYYIDDNAEGRKVTLMSELMK
jgi:DNA polymerase-3 subunit alpha